MDDDGQKGQRLSKGTVPYELISKKVDDLWDEYGGNFSSWPVPEKVYDEFAHELIPYGRNRKDKCRTLYARLIKAKFQENGQFAYLWCTYI